MATSGSYDFTVTRDDIIRMAMLFIGKLGENEVPTASETDDCSTILNMMAKQWMGKQDFAPGLKMWTRRRGELMLSSTKGTYLLGPTGDDWAASVTQDFTTAASAQGATFVSFTTATTVIGTPAHIVIQLDSGDTYSVAVTSITTSGPNTHLNFAVGLPSSAASGNLVFGYVSKQTRPLTLETAVLRDSGNNDIPMRFMTLKDYELLPSKANAEFVSDPLSCYYESQLDNGVLYLDVGGAADVTKHIHIVYLEPVQDFDQPLDNPEYPQQWYMALSWGLAKNICPMFNAPWTTEMQANFIESVAIAKETEPESESMFFNPGND